MKGGFKDSPLRLNEDLSALDSWDETAILARAKKLAAFATDVWPAPSLPAEVLEDYAPKPKKAGICTLEDFPLLSEEQPMRSVFEALRKEVMTLDPDVTEEVLKQYVAYKAETNFVDVVPQKKRLRLSLNMPFHGLHDPKGLAKDVTDLGRWGNGDAEVELASVEELPYVMGLIRQAFERQMDG
jgi:predicted transport protein